MDFKVNINHFTCDTNSQLQIIIMYQKLHSNCQFKFWNSNKIVKTPIHMSIHNKTLVIGCKFLKLIPLESYRVKFHIINKKHSFGGHKHSGVTNVFFGDRNSWESAETYLAKILYAVCCRPGNWQCETQPRTILAT